MEDNAENKWVTASDSATTSRTDFEPLSEISDDIGGNATPKIHLADKGVQYVLDDEISDGRFKLSYDMYIDKTTVNSGYGRYFRTYLDNAAHAFDAATGVAAAEDTSASFFHMMDYQDALYTTSDETLLGATQNNSSDLVPPKAAALSETKLEGEKWYRVVIDGDLTDNVVVVSIYAHGDKYSEAPDMTTPIISANGYFTEGRDRKLKQIKFRRTAGGDNYYDNIKLEKEAK